MTLNLTIQDQPNGIALPDLTPRLTRCVISTNQHGDEACQISAPLTLASAFQRYDRSGLPHALVSDGAAVPFQGRVEDVAIHSDGIDMTALGYARAMGDTPYTALWSTTDYKLWRPVNGNDRSARTPDKYNIDLNGRIYLSTKKGQTYGNLSDIGSVVIQVPYGSGKKIVGFSFDYTINLPTAGGANTWQLRYNTFDEGWINAAATVITATNGTTFARTVHYVTTACDYLELAIFNATGANSTPAGEDGANFVQILNLRVVTSTANRVNTTLGTTFGAGGPQTVTPPSMANIYVGQQLQIKQGTSTSSSVVVTAVTSTTFTATFPGPYNLADSVNAHVVYADEVVKDMRATVSTLNSTQLAANNLLIQSPQIDLVNEIYQDRSMTDILDYLTTLGDSQDRQWEWGVEAAQQLYFRPAGSTARTWYVDVSDIDIQRSIDPLANSIYATYQDAFGRTLRTTANSDADSVARYGLTRRRAVAASTSSSTQAAIQQAAALEDNSTPTPRFGITFEAIYNAGGGRVPIWIPRAGDTIVIRNLPPTISAAIDEVRSFRIARSSCDLIGRVLTVEPVTPLPRLAALLTQALPSGIGFHGAPFIKPL